MLCKIIKKRSIFAWKTLLDADALSCKVGEESFTDFLILELAKGAIFGGYTVKAFTKRQEAVNGADWELWLTGPSGKWFGYRIQAKVIRVSSLKYHHLYPAGGQAQVNKLITAAAAVSAVPIYVLYSAWPSTASGTPTWNCGTYSQDTRLWGMTVISAYNILKLAPLNSLATLSSYMQPFHCLFCCNGYGGGDLPTKAHKFAQARISERALLFESAPLHVQQLLDRKSEHITEESHVDLPNDLRQLVVINQNEPAKT